MAKRIDLIVKAKGLVELAFGLKKNKINRAVGAALDYAVDQQLMAESAKLAALDNMGKFTDDPEALRSAINDYCEACDQLADWKAREEQIKALQAALEEEVEEEPEK